MGRRAKPNKVRAEAKRPRALETPKDEGAKVRDLEKRLAEALKREAEALEQQTATAEILTVISQSPTDVQPVFDTILQSAVQLSGALMGGIYQFDGELIHLTGVHGTRSDAVPLHARDFPRPPDRGFVAARAILERRAIQMPDALEDTEFQGKEFARAAGWRSSLSVPMLRDGQPIGVISVARAETGLVPETIVALLRTFADQAVIAIENVRLFKELEERNRDLTESLEQQTATSEILRVISSSPTDVQPVFDTIARSAVRLCDALGGNVQRFDGELMYLVASHNWAPEGLELARRRLPIRPTRSRGAGRAVLSRAVVHIPDVLEDPEYSPDAALAGGWRTILSVPMLREGNPVGAITVTRAAVRPFSENQIELLKTFADQAVIAIENVRLFTELQDKNRALTEAHAQVRETLEQQTATAEILSVIASSPTDLKPVFDAVAASAARLCEALDAALYLRDGDRLRLVAHRGPIPYGTVGEFTLALVREHVVGRAVLDGRSVHIADLQAEMDEFPEGNELARRFGHRTVLAVPLTREGVAIGVIFVRRAEVHLFTARQAALLQTFADQAVIAIENVRLFTELQTSNRELTTALDTQTATSDILRVISQSQTDVQPVFDVIVENACRLCDGVFANAVRFDGALMYNMAQYGFSPEAREMLLRAFPTASLARSMSGRAILNRAVVQSEDMSTDVETTISHQLSRLMGFRAQVSVPMLRDGVPVGAITVARRERGPFPERQVDLLKTFADQAVIAIDNVRLFKELEARNRDLTDALARQTATSEVLHAISRAPTDAQPVFDTIVRSAVPLCGGLFSTLYQFDGELLHRVAQHNYTPEALEASDRVFPARPTRGLGAGRAILERAVVHMPDVDVDPEHQYRGLSRAIGIRSSLWVPMLREGAPVGVITVARAKAGPFSDSEIALLKTFADQAVIAIENARLLSELQARTQELSRSVDELQALGEVGQAISSTLDLQTVLSTIVARATQLSGTDAGVIYEYDEQREVFVPRASEHLEAEIVETMLATPVRKGQGATGRLAEIQEPIQVPDILAAPAESRVRGALVRAGYRALLAIPLVREDHLLGGLTVIRKTTGAFAPEVIELLQTFATQSSLAIQNARLFLEIEDKSRQLEAASQHKSEFLANMSHELRTPLNAIIGFSEVLTERMFGELNEKQDEYLKDIYASGQHLLSLINDILDLSKIEAGRMELEPTDFDLPSAIDNALTLVRERAGRRGITLGREIDQRVGMIRADERKVKQVVLNLLSNAIKFTPEGGQIDIRAAVNEGLVEVSVTDTGVGIAPEDQEAVFEEFRQVGTADKKVEGTGLGLALSRKFIELHGGRIRVESQVGHGSTFTFTLPVRRNE